MRRRLVLAIAVVVLATPSLAGDDRMEFTPFVGYRFGGDFQSVSTGQQFDLASSGSYGFTFDFPVQEDAKIELLYSKQDTEIETGGFQGMNELDLAVEYFQVGGLFQPSDDEDLQPFVTFSLGATRMNPASPDFSSETRFSLSIGGGGKFFFGETIGIRLEGRIYGTIMDGGGAVFCGGSGCTFGFGGNALWQGELNLGLIIGF